MSNKSPKAVVAWTVEDMRNTAFECLRARQAENDPELGIGVTPEAMFAICNALEDAGITYLGAVDEDENQLQLGFDENDTDGETFN